MTATLGDYFTLQRGNTYQGALLGQPGPVLLGLASIARNGGFKANNLKTYGGLSDDRMLLKPGDMYVSLKDVTQSADLLGAVARVPADIHLGRLTQDTVKLVFKKTGAPTGYLYWLLRTPDYREYCRAHSTGTTNLGLARDDFLAFPVPVLTEERRLIAELLQTLDDKMELNRQTNETLEEMARSIFKDWFVDFGPTRAKAEGRAPYLASDLWSLFPDRLDDEGKPEGWQTGSLLDACELKRGYDLPSAQRSPGPYPIISSSGATGFHSAFMANGPGVITGRYGTIGEVYFINEPYWPLNTTLYVRDFKGSSHHFVYYTVSQLDFLKYSDKGAVPGINRNHLHQAQVFMPPQAVQGIFEQTLTPIWLRRDANNAESTTLGRLRDLLLPKLMSGKIRVGEAEALAVAAQ